MLQTVVYTWLGVAMVHASELSPQSDCLVSHGCDALACEYDASMREERHRAMLRFFGRRWFLQPQDDLARFEHVDDRDWHIPPNIWLLARQRQDEWRFDTSVCAPMETAARSHRCFTWPTDADHLETCLKRLTVDACPTIAITYRRYDDTPFSSGSMTWWSSRGEDWPFETYDLDLVDDAYCLSIRFDNATTWHPNLRFCASRPACLPDVNQCAHSAHV